MKKTKIVCSIGPVSDSIEIMKELVYAGMNVARINFSHATYEQVDKVLNVINEVREQTSRNIGVLYDTKGPDFRCGIMENDRITLEDGAYIKIVKENVIGNANRFTVNHPESLDKIKVGNIILLEDGLFKLEATSTDNEGINCKILCGGVLFSKKGINVPGVDLELPFISQNDINDITYACHNEGQFLALSFVESKDNVMEIRKILENNNRKDIKIISKIESSRAISNLDDIIKASDGIMVARGDLGVEVPMQELPILQKMIIKKCREYGKFVIVATEMLASMYTSPRPTRAEVTDISNAVLDGTDAVMLSGETTVGKHPIEAVRYMADICETTENYYNCEGHVSENADNDITIAIANAVLTTVSSLNVKAIVVPTTGGHSAMVMSNLRPKPMILATCPNETVARGLTLNFGVYAKVVPEYKSMDETVHESKKQVAQAFSLNKNDVIIITGGIHDDPNVKQTNFLKIEEI